MNNFYFDKKTLDDYKEKPERFQNEQDGFAKVYCVESIATLFPNGTDNPPVSFFRHMNVDKTRFAGMVKTSDNPLGVQREAHVHDLAGPNDHMKPYQCLDEKPLMYGYSYEEPFCEYRYYENGKITWKEGKDGSILDVELEPFPVAFFLHRCEQFPVSTFYTHPHVIKGTYEGKPVIGIGNDDRQYIPDVKVDAVAQEKNYQKTTDYMSANCAGVREDGRREIAFFNGEYGHLAGGYWLEGEEPVVDGNVEIIGDWVHLPYCDDGTCVMTDFIFKIGPKTIHFNGKWGFKGWTAEPNLSKHGQSQISGTFYEGDTPYKHQVWQTFVENMEAYDEKLKKVGYSVID